MNFVHLEFLNSDLCEVIFPMVKKIPLDPPFVKGGIVPHENHFPSLKKRGQGRFGPAPLFFQRLRLGLSFVGTLLDDCGDPLDVVEIDGRLAWQLDQIRPDSLRIRQSIPDTAAKAVEQMDRHVAALDFVARVAERMDYVRSQILTTPSRYYMDHLRETGGAGPVRYELQSIIAAQQFLIRVNARALCHDVFTKRLHQRRRRRSLEVGPPLSAVRARRRARIFTARAKFQQPRRKAAPALPDEYRQKLS